ncbi:hypothetical protein B566_EDAN000277 [Ephemera danica]|nr:hypothetical protein B566_EDAN000277 [Ephemera danica]
MAYSDKVVDHFNNPRNMGSFKKDEDGVGTGMVGAPECGDVMKLQIKVQNDTIVDAKFKTFGCGSAIASSSLATEWLKGKTIEEAQKIKNTDIVQELNLPPVKIHCSVLAEDAIKAALADYQKKADTKRERTMDTTNTETQAPVISLTDAAIKEVKRLINVQGIEEGGLRLGVKGGGCSGLSYTINFDEKIGQYDQVYDFDGVKIIVDAKSAIYLQGTQLDYHKDLMGGNFKFVNPNANKTCGCGESFSA